MAYAMVCYVIGVASAITAAFVVGPPGGPWPSYLVLGFVTLIGGVAVGHLLGLFLPPFLAPIASAVTIYVCLIFTYPYPHLAFWVVSGRPQAEIDLFSLAVRSGVALSLALAAVLVASLATADVVNRQYRLAGIFAVGLVGLSVWVVATGGDLRQHRVAPDPLCSEPIPRVCVWPDHAMRLDRVAELAQRLPQSTLGVLPVPDAFYEEGLRGPAPGITMEAGKPPFELTLHDERSALAMMVWQLIPNVGDCVWEAGDAEVREAQNAREMLFAWVYSRTVNSTSEFADEPVLEAAIDDVVEQPPPSQVEWAELQVEVVTGDACG
ncbi:hypothetical protein JQS43_24915 [Natronosporangium hydrolyticum]|uniref:DUF7224 domain-containing protein n=1 Tax=Natronosporangium hydrolyticum TaxID=2811111 RepID=A0A895YGZ6_9ACTN|nr:hypothetical protein [Natronosporangium hydrolyticum]QSB14663.1 hypothetical protein JQS43_24915 [Natronosporangium hydrolyticum]